MGPIKRKDGPTNESFVRSKKGSHENRPSKRLKPNDSSELAKPAKIQNSMPLQSSGILRIKDEDKAFPRGGASILTPLEHKQIHLDAARDVLFEQQSAIKKNEPQNFDEMDSKRAIASEKRKVKAKGKGHKGAAAKEAEDDQIVIESLSFKRLIPGSLVLGQVSQINAHDIALALPNNLTGYVPLTSISKKLTERIEAVAADDLEADDEEKNETDEVDPRTMFSMCQYLRAYVVSTSDSNPHKTEAGKRRIELSLQPDQSNYGITINELVPDSMIMASVVSVEDHGLIMDLGLKDPEVRGFMSTREIGYGVDISKIQEGAVFLCMIVGLSSNGKIVKLSADIQKFANTKKPKYLAEAPTVDAFLPGTAVELLVVEVTHRGIVGKVMGMIDVTADLIHSGANVDGRSLEKKYKIGSKIKGRIVCTFPKKESKKLGVSLLDHVMSLLPAKVHEAGQHQDPLEFLPLSTIVEQITVKKVESGVGLFVDVGAKGVPGFVHISRVTDGKIETLSESSGPYKTDSVHRGRVIGYNAIDGTYLVSLEQKILDQLFLRVEDLKVGEVVQGTVEKLVVNAGGVGGVLINLAEGITGLASEMHLADVSLQHPEKKFKEGTKVTARVLSTDPSKRQIRLTLKKTLVNSEAPVFMSYRDVAIGTQSPGTIVNILPGGAVIQFYGNVRGFLPVSEMSEAFIQDPRQHFRVGQVVNVHVLKVDAEAQKLTVSCKDPSAFSSVQENALKRLKIGEIVSAIVAEKSNEDTSLELEGSGLKAILYKGHLTDGSESKNESAFKRIRVGQTLKDLVVLEKSELKHLITLTNKPTILRAAKDRTLLRDFDDVKESKVVNGFVKNITSAGVFVQFGGGLTGLVPRGKLGEAALQLPDFGLQRFQSLTTKIVSVDHGQQRFLLSVKDLESSKMPLAEIFSSNSDGQAASNPVDAEISNFSDLTLGKLTVARIASIKETQINVQLADNIQGRIDVSNVFDSWDDIKDRKYPLKRFTAKQILPVRVLGIHDTRNHRFLPITHREGKTSVFELSAKPSDLSESKSEILTLDKVKPGSSWVAFVNNIGDDCLWVNLTPNIRGRIKSLDVSDDVSLLTDLESNFPVGSAIKVRVTGVDPVNSRLDLSARSTQITEPLTFQNLTKNMVVPGRVTKVTGRQIMVQLSDSVSAPVNLADLSDNYAESNPLAYSKNDIIRVCITDIDVPNKRIRLSTRPSRVLNSSLTVKDPEILSLSQLKVNDIIRGFVKNVANNGVFVSLGGNFTAYVRVSDLSDSYLKEWKENFQVDQLVSGKIILVDPTLSHVQMSLKLSVMNSDYVRPLAFDDLKVGQVVTGKIRKVEDFGVFILVDGSLHVSGLCHKSEMAEEKVEDVRKLYDEGDAVKAKVLKVDFNKRRVNFGLKASYFDKHVESEQNSDDNSDDGGVRFEIDSSDGDIMEVEDIKMGDITAVPSESQKLGHKSANEVLQDVPEPDGPFGLNVGGFDWTAGVMDDFDEQDTQPSDGENLEDLPKKKRKRKASITIDRTGELDANGPQSVSDFERLLLGEPNSSNLWIEYMAFQVKLSELAQARTVAERAIQTISIREEAEKMNVWIALLNLENSFGSDESTEEVFKRACQYNDAQEIHERLTSIYIQSGKHSKADELFQILVKKFSQSPTVWYNYAHFLHRTLSATDRARLLLPRAIQALPTHTHLSLTVKFAALEFHSPCGSPERGRTMFEGLLATYPKRLDLWNQLLDLETQQGDAEIIRAVFERVLKTKGLKPKGAKAWFKRWSSWEEENGDERSQEKVRAKAEEWVRAVEERKAAKSEDEAE